MLVQPGRSEVHEILPLTSLRFILALWVLLHHARHTLGSQPFLISNFLSVAYTAVGVFYTLSGFVLAINYLAGEAPMNARRYFRARFARIYPTYLLSLLAALPLWVVSCLEVSPVRVVAQTAPWVFLAVLLLVQSWLGPLADHGKHGIHAG